MTWILGEPDTLATNHFTLKPSRHFSFVISDVKYIILLIRSKYPQIRCFGYLYPSVSVLGCKYYRYNIFWLAKKCLVTLKENMS